MSITKRCAPKNILILSNYSTCVCAISHKVLAGPPAANWKINFVFLPPLFLKVLTKIYTHASSKTLHYASVNTNKRERRPTALPLHNRHFILYCSKNFCISLFKPYQRLPMISRFGEASKRGGTPLPFFLLPLYGYYFPLTCSAHGTSPRWWPAHPGNLRSPPVWSGYRPWPR